MPACRGSSCSGRRAGAGGGYQASWHTSICVPAQSLDAAVFCSCFAGHSASQNTVRQKPRLVCLGTLLLAIDLRGEGAQPAMADLTELYKQASAWHRVWGWALGP